MCGISVRISLGPSNDSKTPKTPGVEAIKGQLDRSLDLIVHRGPDSKGIWVNDDGSVGLGHCRLSIEDLSDAGNQPLHSDDGGVHAVINGEIYDHERIRSELEQNHGYHFKGHSDSEVVVALYTVYGAPAFLDHLRGEFSLVIYDQRQGRIIATRDRFGIKPLFWTIIDEEDERVLLFATEMKTFLAMGWKPKWDVQSAFQAGWIFDDRSLFKGVKKLTPGYWMEITLPEGQLRRHLYWDSDYNDKRQVETRTVEEMIEGVREKLIEAIRLRLRADVPVGIYLSGGIDSSLIAGIVAKLAREENITLGSKKGQVTCFSIEFPNSPLDEFDVAKRTADWLGVDIVKCKADEAALAEHFENSVYHCEYQTFDLGPTGKTMLSSIPREAGFKVVLTGEGSDEHFAGYPFTPQDFLLEPDLSWPASKLTQDTEHLNQMQRAAAELFDRQVAALGVKGEKFAWDETCRAYHQANRVNMPNAVLGMSGATFPMWAPWVVEKWSGLDLREAVIKAMSPAAREKILNQWHPLHTSLYITTKTFLNNYLLVSLGDRTEMAHSIEARPPFLDHNLVEYVNRLPPSLKLRCTSDLDSNIDQQNQEPQLIEKWILREVGKPFIPEEIYNRKKQPYLAPVKWPQNGPLHQMFQTLCTKEAIENLGFVSWAPVERALQHAFGPDGDQGLFRLLVCVAGWVVLSQRFGVEKATEAEWADSPLYDPWCDF